MHILALLIILIGIGIICLPFYIPSVFLDYFNSKYGMGCAFITLILCFVSLFIGDEWIDILSGKEELPFAFQCVYIIGIPLLILFTIFALKNKHCTNVYCIEPPNHKTKFWCYSILLVLQFSLAKQTYEYLNPPTATEIAFGGAHKTSGFIIIFQAIIVILLTILFLWVRLKGKVSSAPRNILGLVLKYGWIRYWYVLEHFRGQCIICFRKYFYVGGRIFDKKDILDVGYANDILTIQLKEETITVNTDKSDDAAFQEKGNLINYFEEMAALNNPPHKEEQAKPQKRDLISFKANK